MCQFISVLVLKGEPPKVLHRAGVDSHSELERIFSVRERPSASATDQPFAKVEFVPDWAKDVSKPEAWTLIVDEPRKPDWWTDDVEVRARRDLWSIVKGMLTKGEQEEDGGDWIVVGGTKLTLKNGRAYAMPQSSVVARGSSRVVAWDSSRVEAWDSSSVEARGSSSVVARGSSRVVAWDSSSVEARDSSSVVACDSSRVVACDSSRVEARDSSSVVASSTYSAIIGRALWDGTGYRPLWCKIEVGKTYGVRDGELKEVEAVKK